MVGRIKPLHTSRLQQLSSLGAKHSRIIAIAIPIASAVHAGFAHSAILAQLAAICTAHVGSISVGHTVPCWCCRPPNMRSLSYLTSARSGVVLQSSDFAMDDASLRYVL
jgi:hypothetical protein